ncbi:MAG: hypothetical protein A2226_00270 [Candidatus Veblenbacteria bacterium RIFOXYA2_FULL_43_9]|uniref:Isoleucine--tRNA ligase n=1 Tax=Candidatus Veblenbacteria bacterium RIFOXYA2_FULL_43_9 TaxID=1802425 RepID=A0A1G2Q3H7_9BACT|nr:MAG: hypothetical protein A2226_00270 [Candidatus Veblenbacteria bacterium RIFOXYA2_FULL_43_9]
MVKFPDLEDKWLKYWQDNKIFEKSLAKPAPHGNFVFFEGPPTANGRPGIHHVLARAFKDLIPRYKTMRGFRVERKAGWDTQGLPVELQVEKELGFKGKPDIEKYGVKEFNNKCRADVWKYKEDWEKLTKRMGFWLDLEHPYVTYENYYLESLWWIFKQVDKAGLLYQDYKVLPHCPRCGTALSSHEVALGYKSIPDKAVYVKFKIKNQKSKIKIDENTYILSWTTTPWTLPGNVALTVGNNIEYTKARILPEAQFVNSVDPILNKSTEYVIFSREIFEKIPKSDLGRVFMGQALEEEENLKGKDLVGLEYEPLFDIKQLQNEKSHRVYAADFVTTTEGTGVVHTAVMYGEDDFNLGTAEGLPKYHTVDEAGNFTKDVPQWQGKFVKDKKIEQEIIDYLSEQGKKGFSGLFGEPHEYTHDYPFCWRCSTPLLYYAKPSWFIKMSALRDELQAANAKINWYPEHIKHGRFGEWLDGVKDWAISRERYWGTPLPIWRCTNDKCKHQVVIESLVDLAQTSGQEQVASGDFDMHRPFIDEVSWSCKKCDDKGEMKRVPEVADCWFDSGSMPFAQWGYPHAKDSNSQLKEHYPADYISEAIDQTRGWFYTLLAVAALLKKAGAIKEIPPYKNVICLGHINDKHGQKMSKSKGNIVDPWEIMNKYGADALRLHFYIANQPGEPKNFDENDVDQVVKKTLLILMNVMIFYELYQDKAEASRIAPKSDNVLDKWVLALLQQTTNEVTDHLEHYEITEAGRKLADFVTELSTWYVRRSRDRFKSGGKDAGLARTTLGFVLRQVAILLAPFTPFVADEVYSRVRGRFESVHLEEWLKQNKLSVEDAQLLDDMTKARQEVEIALAQRAAVGLKVRQVLGSLTTTVAFDDDIKTIIADEVNVQEVRHGTETKLDTQMNDELKSLGLVREFTRQVNALRKELKLTIKDKVNLVVQVPDQLKSAIEKQLAEVKRAVIAESIEFSDQAQEHKIELNEIKISITLKK